MIYMDNAATTAICKKAKEEMLPFFDVKYANPSGAYRLAAESKREIEKSRRRIAEIIGASSSEIYFTSGGTEADNWALNSVMIKEKAKCKTPHLITTRIEHHAILNTCKNLEKNGVKVTYLPVNNYGMISLKDLKDSITDETRLISIMFANNEVGTIEPIYEIGKIAKANNIFFHTDAVQAVAHVPIMVKKMNIDLLSASGHKFNAPKGTGFLYVSNNIDVEPLIFGGGQEEGKRSGTENVPGIVGLGAAALYHRQNMGRFQNRECDMRNYMIKKILATIDNVTLNGHPAKRLCGNINITIEGVNGGAVVAMMDRVGICISAGSACSTKSGKPSHVLTAIGLNDDAANGSIRITLSAENTKEEIDIVVEKLKKIVEELRRK